MQLQYIIIPEWIDQALSRAGKPRELLLDLNGLTSILSKGDVAFYALLNTAMFDGLIHDYVEATFGRVDLLSSLHASDDKGLGRAFDKLMMEGREASFEDLYEPDYLPPTDLPEDYFKNHKYHSFELVRVHDNVLGYIAKKEPSIVKSVEHGPAAVTIESVRTQLNSVSNAIKLMLGYIKFEEIALTSLFRQYVKYTKTGLGV